MRRRSRRYATSLTLLAAISTVGSPAVASHCAPGFVHGGETKLDASGGFVSNCVRGSGGSPGAGGAASSGGGSSAPPRVFVPHVFPSAEPDGTPCIGVEMRGYDPADAPTTETTGSIGFFGWYEANTSFVDGVVTTPQRCAAAGGGPSLPQVRDSVLLTVRGQLPRPSTTIAPGYALTGLRMYLETGRPLTWSRDVSVTAGGVTFEASIEATGTYEVDWGDGTTTGPHDVPGAPYPSGTVTHVWTDRGTVRVAVTDTWQVTFVTPYGSETVSATLDPVVSPPFEVREVQAVRER